MRYSKFSNGQEHIVFELVWDVFMKFEAPDYPDEGIQTFKAFIQPENLQQLAEDGWPIYCCFAHDQLIGVLAFRKNRTHISLLFVREEYHRQGIAKSMLTHALNEIRESDPAINQITVNSSPYAKNIYEKMGFIAMDSVQQQEGILFIPMVKRLQIPFKAQS
ncbi:MAG: GNAT family N-acetyltransferase [Ignavibacteriales bacterium]